MKKGCLFDLDGTLVNSITDLALSTNEVLKLHHLPTHDISQYNIVFLGSPNWWGTITPQVSSFLEKYDLSGKTVVPFITHGGGGQQNTIADIMTQCKNCHVVQEGWVGYGNRTMGINGWLEDLGL